MKIAVNEVSRKAMSIIVREGGRVVYNATEDIVIIVLPETARIQSPSVQDAYIELDEIVFRYHRAWGIEESYLVMANEEMNQ